MVKSAVFSKKQKRITLSDYSLFSINESLFVQQFRIGYLLCLMFAWAAATRAIGTRKGEQLT
jgi:hypothetical protein